MNKVVIFGAGNIGRSFIGNVFSSNGVSVTFVDAYNDLVNEIKQKKGYRILIKRNNKADEEIRVKNIDALHSSETDAIISCLSECDLCATSVGQGALPKVIPLIAEGIKLRSQKQSSPLDVIIAENIRNGAVFFKKLLKENGLSGEEAGLIETSIGKMVPIMKAEDLEKDPLILHAEEYNTLILDKKGFKNAVPDFPEIKAVENIAAWVDRKLFIHNLGHAASAYCGYEKYPSRKLLVEVLEDDLIKSKVRNAMGEASAALLMEYPEDFTKESLSAHIDDLLFRLQNRALGDSIFRVGRDLTRKLGRDDRILGAAGLCLKHKLPCDEIMGVFKSALKFAASDDNGELFKADQVFLKSVKKIGIYKSLITICGLNPEKDKNILSEIKRIL